MSSNKYWDMWMERKKNINSGTREHSREKSPTPVHILANNANNERTYNSFASDRQNYINFLETKLETNPDSELKERILEIVATCADQEKKINKLTQIIELNSNIQNKSDSKLNFDLSKIDTILEKRLKELSRSFIDRKAYEARLHQMEIQINNNSNVNPSSMNNMEYNEMFVSNLDFEDFRRHMNTSFTRLERNLTELLQNNIDDLDTKVLKLKQLVDNKSREIDSSHAERLRYVDSKITDAIDQLKYSHLEKFTEIDEVNQKSIENRLRYLEKKFDRADLTNSGNMSGRLSTNRNVERYEKKLDYLEEKIIETSSIALRAEKASIDIEKTVLNKLSKSEKRNKNDNNDHDELRYTGEFIELTSLKRQVESIDRKFTSKFDKVKQYMNESNELLKSHSKLLALNDNPIETKRNGSINDLDYEKVKSLISKSEKKLSNLLVKESFANQEELREKIERCVHQVSEFMKKYLSSSRTVNSQMKSINSRIEQLDEKMATNKGTERDRASSNLQRTLTTRRTNMSPSPVIQRSYSEKVPKKSRALSAGNRENKNSSDKRVRTPKRAQSQSDLLKTKKSTNVANDHNAKITLNEHKKNFNTRLDVLEKMYDEFNKR